MAWNMMKNTYDHLINPKKTNAIQIGSVSNKILKGRDVNQCCKSKD